MRTVANVFGWCAAPLFALCALPAGATDTQVGEALFSRYCATCHGHGAAGDGASASALDTSPENLTTLAAGNGGVFPVARVVRRVEGTDRMGADGSPMPVYGAFFEGAPTVQIETEEGLMTASLPVLEIVTYLKGLQR
ncbi:c-type cytochrome [Tropicimonas marinistellae]|uniref:c-type cytochrome n=1 Tax=Tropicimonas marinistellae TaxID=1739787 RepID=UPI00083153B8|nr:c-type cytochrome [Tropicimonas marinistellae]